MVIADAEHGDAGFQPLALQAFRRDGAIEHAKRPQQMRFPGRPAVPEARLTHSRLPFRAAAATNMAPARSAYLRTRPRAVRPPAPGPPGILRAPRGRPKAGLAVLHTPP